MSRGMPFTKHFDETLRKGIYETQIPNINFLYEVSSTKNVDYDIGDSVVLPDGRVFFYCLSGGACDTFVANQFAVEIPALSPFPHR